MPLHAADFLVGLKKWSPSCNALRIKQARSALSPCFAPTFVVNKRLTRKERGDGRINLLEASPQFSHHFLCLVSSLSITGKKNKLSMWDEEGFLVWTEKIESERHEKEWLMEWVREISCMLCSVFPQRPGNC